MSLFHKSKGFIFACLLVSISSKAAPFQVNGVWYEYESATHDLCFVTAAPYGEEKPKGDIVIPEQITFNGETSMVVAITNYAFRDCKYLHSVDIPATVQRIRNYAFQGSGIEEITIPNTVTLLQGQLFVDCQNLRRVVIEYNPNIHAIDAEMFLRCTALEEVVFYPNITSFGDNCFKGSGIKEITIPNYITKIGNRCFESCPNLKKFVLEDEREPLSAYDYTWLTVGDYPFMRTSLEEVYIGRNINGYHGFMHGYGATDGEYCEDALKKVTFAAGLQFYPTFETCQGIEEVWSLSADPQPFATSTGSLPFYNKVYENATLYVPSECLEQYKETNGWKEFQQIEPIQTLASKSLKADDKDKMSDIYNLQGQKVNGNSAKDKIIIINGKKIIH